ncbi:TIR domain-containing protein [Duganella sp. HH101]|uniref:TIR domain-containing protein n=1 Tax=Duganella sp. HH101 TaxID=1781066 RepID=UPI000894183E|nr:nucleotide-binding protein [Duganella sp. HH101]OFA03720.1 putative nucleotide-binding protein containing TIR-like domain protein [Duganella sp. HH101]
MFNLLISSNADAWLQSPYELERDRVAIEYTVDEISERYKLLDSTAIDELKGFPTLFVTENEAVETRIGIITSIKIRLSTVLIGFELDPIFPALPKGTIENIRRDIDLGRWELSRTHWAIKDEPIFDILVKKGYITLDQVKEFQRLRSTNYPDPQVIPTPAGVLNTKQVFIVHGHDDIAKLEMASFIKSLGLEPIILHLQASSGRTIIEKIEYYSNVGFGIVLYTPCDIGCKAGALNYLYRARQNVVFEHGYLIGKLGRSRVAAVIKGGVEIPNDISGVIYISLDHENIWQEFIKKELRAVGYKV